MTDDQREIGRKAAIMICESFGFYAAAHVLKSGKDGMISVTRWSTPRDLRLALDECLDGDYPALYIEDRR
jgi:hypothetical protein